MTAVIARIRSVPQERAMAYAVLGVILVVFLAALTFVFRDGVVGTALSIITVIVALANLAWLILTWKNKWTRDGGDDA